MNIKTTLFSLAIGSIVCLSAVPVQADAFRITRERFEDSQQQNYRDRNEGRDSKQRPNKEQSRQEAPRRAHDDNRVQRDHDRKKYRPERRKADKRHDRYHEDRPVRRYDRDRYYQPSSGLYAKVKRKVKPVAKLKRPKHRIYYRDHYRHEYHYVRGPWYYTRYISPYPRHYHPIGFRLRVLPNPYLSIVVGGFPYFYFDGVFYQSFNSGYIVVSAPIGAFVSTLPDGFIAFSIGLATYYYLNNTYYVWDDSRDGYVVVEKPAGADNAMTKETSGRLFVYPNKGQDEEQQARDRYECHRWAVSETGFDPTLEEEEYSTKDNDHYRRAIAACLEGRDYTVK